MHRLQNAPRSSRTGVFLVHTRPNSSWESPIVDGHWDAFSKIEMTPILPIVPIRSATVLGRCFNYVHTCRKNPMGSEKSPILKILALNIIYGSQLTVASFKCLNSHCFLKCLWSEKFWFPIFKQHWSLYCYDDVLRAIFTQKNIWVPKLVMQIIILQEMK